MNSYNIVNYKLRPQKQIERGIFADLLNDFTWILGTPVNYIGMGSLFFTDFTYFNKNCHLNRMISIEAMVDKNGDFDYKKEKRFINNKPLDKIELLPKSVSDAIEDLPLDSSAFIWLDYDGTFNTGIIDDLEKIIKGITKPCILAISVKRGVDSMYKSHQEIAVDRCNEDYKTYRVDDGEADEELNKDNYTMVALDICSRYLKEKTKTYNGLYGKKLEFSKIGSIQYEDGAKMLTVIWSVLDIEDSKAEELQRKYSEFEAKNGLNLKMEHLTLYEKQILDRCPREELDTKIEELGLERSLVDQYYKYAKYVPEYTEVYI